MEDAIFEFSTGEDLKAEKILMGIIEVDKKSIDAFRALSEVSLSLQKLDQAEECCRKALEIDPNDLTCVVSLARILVKKGDKDGAESASAKARVLGWQEELADDETID